MPRRPLPRGDLLIRTNRRSASLATVRVTHKPSGLSAQATNRSAFLATEAAIAELEDKLDGPDGCHVGRA